MTDPTPPNEELSTDLRQRLEALPRAIEPERDLWPTIADRLHEPLPDAERPGRPVVQARDRFRRALAAVLYMALGALVTWFAMTARAPEKTTSNDGSILAVPASTAHLGVGAEGLAAIEADFLRAREALWLDVLARRDQLEPSTVAVVEQNLAIIDRAIRDLRKALDTDPGNPSLERRLIDSHRRSLDLLRRLSKEA